MVLKNDFHAFAKLQNYFMVLHDTPGAKFKVNIHLFSLTWTKCISQTLCMNTQTTLEIKYQLIVTDYENDYGPIYEARGRNKVNNPVFGEWGTGLILY